MFVTLQALGVKQPVSRRSVQSPQTRCGLQTLGTCPIFFGCIKLRSSTSVVVLPAWQCDSCEFHEVSCELHGLCRAPYARGETGKHVVEVGAVHRACVDSFANKWISPELSVLPNDRSP